MELRHDMLTHGVNIVTAAHEGKRAGLAVAWATQVAKDRVMICVGSQSATRGLILESGAFGLSTLGADQLDLARRFGRQSSRNVDKFEGLDVHVGETGSPLLDDCLLALDCRVETTFDHEGHKLIVGKVLSVERMGGDRGPLLYKEEDY